MSQPYSPIAYSLIVCPEGSRSGLRKLSTTNRTWYETIAPIASHAAVFEITADLFTAVLVMDTLLGRKVCKLEFHVATKRWNVQLPTTPIRTT